MGVFCCHITYKYVLICALILFLFRTNDYLWMLDILNGTETDPIWQFCGDGDLEGLRKALEQGEDLSDTDGSYGLSGLMWTVIYSQDRVMEFLLKQPSIDVNQRNNTGNTALHLACCTQDRVTAVSMLVGHPSIGLNAKNSKGATPLMLATQSGIIDNVKVMMAVHGVDLETKDGDGRSLEEVAR